MSEDEKDLNGNEEVEDNQTEEEKGEEKKTIGQKIADIDPEDVGKKVDGFVGWISEKLKGLKIDKSTPEGKKKAKEWRNTILGLVAFILIGNFLNDGKITDIIPARFVVAKLVEESTPVNYPNMTYGEAFDAICDNGSWKYVTKEKGLYYVEYNGKLKRSSNGKGDLCVQFAVDKDSDYFNISYLEYEGQSATTEYEYSTTLYIIFETADYMIKNGVPADTSPVNSFSNKVGSTQAAAPAPTVPETEDDYVFDPNGAAKADSYYDEESAVYSIEEASGDLPDDSSDMPNSNTLGSEYIFDTSLEFPELMSYDAWTKGKGQLWYCADTGLYAYTDIDDSTGIPVVVFSTDGTYDGIVYRFVPQATDDSIGMLRAYGDFVDDNMIYRGANMGVTWNTNDYTAFYVSGPKDMPHMVIGNYFLQQQ